MNIRGRAEAKGPWGPRTFTSAKSHLGKRPANKQLWANGGLDLNIRANCPGSDRDLLSSHCRCHKIQELHNRCMSEEKAAFNTHDDDKPQGVQGDLVENSSDVTMLKRLANHPEWRLPAECFGEVPESMAEIVRDPQKSARQKTSAAKVLVQLHGQNHNHLANAITTQHRVEGPRSMLHAMRPQLEDGEPSHWLEIASETELRATHRVLYDLGLAEPLPDEPIEKNGEPESCKKRF